MATKKPLDTSFLHGARDAQREHARLFNADNKRRTNSSVRLLHPDEVAGDIDASKLLELTTTVRGTEDQLTLEDLQQFKRNIKNLKERFKGGISAKVMLDKSRKIDRDRANEQIHSAVPISAGAGVIHFITNAGPDYGAVRHHVHVELLNYGSITAKPKSADKLAKELLAGPARWRCDCGRYRFFYSYILTTLQSNYGASETAFPKVRNPGLGGTCCKHIARVAHNMLQSGPLRIFAQKMIERGRADVTAPHVNEMKADAKKMAEAHAALSKRKRDIKDPKTEAEKVAAKAVRDAKSRMKQEAKSKAAADHAAANPEQEAAKPTLTPAQVRKRNNSAQTLLGMGAITQEQFNQITGAT